MGPPPGSAPPKGGPTEVDSQSRHRYTAPTLTEVPASASQDTPSSVLSSMPRTATLFFKCSMVTM